MVNWVGMAALGLACENVAMVIGQPWTAMWLIFWVIANVSTSFYAEELSPAFYNWGVCFPFSSPSCSVPFLLFLLPLSPPSAYSLRAHAFGFPLLTQHLSTPGPCTRSSKPPARSSSMSRTGSGSTLASSSRGWGSTLFCFRCVATL